MYSVYRGESVYRVYRVYRGESVFSVYKMKRTILLAMVVSSVPPSRPATKSISNWWEVYRI